MIMIECPCCEARAELIETEDGYEVWCEYCSNAAGEECIEVEELDHHELIMMVTPSNYYN